MNGELRIVDAVFPPSTRGQRGLQRLPRLAFAVAVGAALHGAVVVWAVASAPSLELWSADLATRVHAQMTHEAEIELPPQPPIEKAPEPPIPPPTPPPPAPSEPAPAPRPVAQARHAPAAPSHAAPAQAAQIIAADSTAAVDLPGVTFATGNAKTYAGGSTSSNGTSTTAVNGPVDPHPQPAPVAHKEPARDLSSAVALDETDWSCAWPREAEADSIDEQSVVLRVVVRADGTAESVKIVGDPGHGFGSTARACAMATHFTPARGRDGNAVRAESPPIRVHFTR